MVYRQTIRGSTYLFNDLKTLMAKATPSRSGDVLAGVAADSEHERIIARMALAEVPLEQFLNEPLVPYEDDEVTRLILDTHAANPSPKSPISRVGEFRDWLSSDDATTETLTRIAPGIIPEMAAAVSKLMRNQDLILAAQKCRVVTRFRNTIGLPGRISVRLQPNHPTDDPRGIAASMLDGLLYGCGDAVIGINPATDSARMPSSRCCNMLDEFRSEYEVPTQTCVLAHVTTTMQAIERGAPVDLVFQSIAGTEAANASFGVNLSICCARPTKPASR